MPRRRRAAANRRSSNRPVVDHTQSENEAVQADAEDVTMANDESVDTPAPAESAATPAQDSEAAAVPSAPPSPPSIQTFPRRKRLGRPPKNRPPDWDLADPNADVASEGGTPFRRKRGRPSMGGTRGRGRGGAAVQATKWAVDKEGTMLDVVNDEVAVPEDTEGETKVDKMGNLLDGREYRVRVFTLLGRGDRLYMLSTEPARCTGFRDSYLFFTKHMRLFKVIISDDQKRDLIDRNIIPHSYKGRAIGVVTARSVFREFGARIVVGGKRIMDDYYVQAARARGDVEGELADPQDQLPPHGEPYNKNQYVAWHGASAVYHTNAPSVPLANAARIPVKRRTAITSENWKYEHALSAVEFNRGLAEMRRRNFNGVYDIHTNTMHYPRSTQPTMWRCEQLTPAEERSQLQLEANGVNGVKDAIMNGTSDEAPSGTSNENAHPNGTTANNPTSDEHKSIFGPVPAVVSRNALVMDIVYSSPPFTFPTGRAGLYGTNRMRDLPRDQYEALPPDSRAAWDDCRRQQDEWYAQWDNDRSKYAGKENLKIIF